MFLYKAGIFQVGGTSTLEEREAKSVKQISEALLKYASFSLAQSIKSSRPLKTLDALYDLFAAFGKAFCVDVEIKSDGKLLQEIKFEGETGFWGPRAKQEFGCAAKKQITYPVVLLGGTPGPIIIIERRCDESILQWQFTAGGEGRSLFW